MPLWSITHPMVLPKWMKAGAKYNNLNNVYASRQGIMYHNTHTHIEECLVSIANLIFKLGAPTIESVNWTPATLALVGGASKTIKGFVNFSEAIAVTATPTLTVKTSRGAIATHGTIVPGTGYIDGTYATTALTGGDGTGAQATIVVSGGAVTTVTVTSAGTYYSVGNVLSATAASLSSNGNISTFTKAGTATGSSSQSGVAQDSSSGAGTGSTWNVSESGGVYTVTNVNKGHGFTALDTITILGSHVGGVNVTNDLTITVTAVTSGSGFSVPVATVTAGSYSLSYNSTDSVLGSGKMEFSNASPLTLVTGEVITIGGAGAATISGTITDKGDVDGTVGNVATTSGIPGGAGYTAHTGVTTTAVGASEGSGLTVDTTVVDGAITAVTKAGTAPAGTSSASALSYDSTTSVGGTGATFSLSWTGGVYTVTAITNHGSTYLPTETITILGNHAGIGGATPANDLVLTVSTIANGFVASVAVNAAGDGYAASDTVTIDGAYTSVATFTVASIATLNAEKDTSVATVQHVTIG